MDLFDFIFFAGLALLAAGLYLISLQLALVVIGTILIIFGFFGAFRKSRKVNK